ncbi:er membrane protein complex subunit 7 [Anaeramoeba flamelloides]|uniref:Er membrane protein complex subunit 7 n=1 Tax=Anaeramoeba flamelloides TaxID=1746091 RepID=A0ABQ8YL74_9EUKA|nr:er membrane protein complex subunit 7 [Anaeramoeba flamelloides]
MISTKKVDLIIVFLSVLALFTLASTTEYCDLEGKISIPMKRRPDQVRIILNGGEHITFSLRNGDFKFALLKSGIYFLEVDSPDYIFAPIKVDVCTKGKAIRAKTADETFQSVKHPLKLLPYGPKIYYEKEPPFNLFKIFKSPLGIVAILALFTILILPKITSNIDQEELQNLQQQREASNFVTNYWDTSFLQCLSDIPICLKTIFCPCLVLAGNKAGADERECNLCDCLCCPREYFTRQQIRSKYGFEESVLMDCLMTTPPLLMLALCQDARELKARKDMK